MDNLFLAICSSSYFLKENDGLFVLSYPAPYQVLIPESGKKCPDSSGMGGRNQPESVAGLNRNRRPEWIGICTCLVSV